MNREPGLYDDQIDLLAEALPERKARPRAGVAYRGRAPHVAASATSQAAAEAIQPKAADLRQQVLDAIRAAGARGLTRPEVADLTGIGDNTVRPRCVELVTAGAIRENGEKRDRCAVLVAVPPEERA